MEDLRPLDEKLDEILTQESFTAESQKFTLGFRLILGSEGSVTALPPDGHEKHTMTDEQIIEAVRHMVEGAEVNIVGSKD